MKLAFLYAGQGSQHVGMGRDLYENYPAFRAVLDAAPVDFDLKQLCFEGPGEQLNDTRYTQPCMVAFAAGVTAVLKEEGITPAYTAGLEGTPNELKLKYLADNDFAALSGEALREAIKGEIKKKDGSLVGKMAAQGTTPRRLTDLIGSLCDLTSGSGDKGTPIVYIQGYFDNYTK